jgi:hypothetical protein
MCNILFHWVATSVETSCSPISSVRSPVYPPRTLVNQSLFFTFPVHISWFLLVECVALSWSPVVAEVARGIFGVRLGLHFSLSSEINGEIPSMLV